MEIDEVEIAKNLKKAVIRIRDYFDMECTLSEVLALRRYVVRSIEANKGANGFSHSNPYEDAFEMLLKEHYGIDFADLQSRKGPSKLLHGRDSDSADEWDRLLNISDHFVCEEFKEYMKLLQERNYIP